MPGLLDILSYWGFATLVSMFTYIYSVLAGCKDFEFSGQILTWTGLSDNPGCRVMS